MTAAAIDLGTNTFHLIIAESNGSNIEVVYKTSISAQLGEGGLTHNIIQPKAFERGLLALDSFAEVLKGYQVDVLKATATSAVRNASNGADFVQAVKARTGIDIEVISGVEEAGYIFKGVQATGMIQGTSLVMDIGGGSTEFILCNEDELIWKKSYDIGAARLLQAFFKSDPLSPQDKQAIIDHVQNSLQDLLEICKQHRPQTLIGSAGAFESFAGMLKIRKGEEVGTLTSAPLDLEAYHELSKQIIRSTHAERVQMPGLIPLRVDMIVIATLLVNFILDNTGISKLSLSTYDLKMGVLQTLLNNYPD
jgi:exopolyphosphatase/guanosine-5'-triphosphate,3'-diphosphate pyrophosphatase